MHSKLALAGLLASVAVFPALAQQAPAPSTPSQRMETTIPAAKSTTGQWRASKLVGIDVYNAANEKIGDISEILLDRSGKTTGVIVSVGGFLGMGQHDVMAQMDQLKFVTNRSAHRRAMDRHDRRPARRRPPPARHAPPMRCGIPTTPS